MDFNTGFKSSLKLVNKNYFEINNIVHLLYMEEKTVLLEMQKQHKMCTEAAEINYLKNILYYRKSVT